MLHMGERTQVSESFPAQMLVPRMAGFTSGCGNFFATLGGMTLAYLLGAIRDAIGSFAPGLYSLSGLCVFGPLCTIALSRMKPVEAM
jgi:MFS transporter, ACS family, D-galactonate transporter